MYLCQGRGTERSQRCWGERPNQCFSLSPSGQALLEQLCQTTCLLLPRIILQDLEHPPYVELLEELVGRGFVVTGARLAMLDSPQALCISQLLSRTKGSVAAKVWNSWSWALLPWHKRRAFYCLALMCCPKALVALLQHCL